MFLLLFSFSIMLIISGCNSANVSEKEASSEKEEVVQAEEESKIQDVGMTRNDLRDEVYNLSKEEKFDEIESLVNEKESLLNEEEISAVKSYLAFYRSDEPISLRAAKLMDEVNYGYSGILAVPIEQAIYSPQEEGSIIFDTYSGSGRTSYDYLDWKYNDSKGAYEEARHYKGLKGKAEVEKIVKEQLIEEAKTKNPTLGMSTEEVEVSLWGKPEKINRSVNQYTTREQWVYGNGQYLYFTDGILTSFQD